MYTNMIDYVSKYFDRADNPRSKCDIRFPFRNNFQHSIRVYRWAMRINAVEKGDADIVAAASIFHDIGKTISMDYSHADISADICSAYLKKTGYSDEKSKKIIRAIKIHPYKDNPNLELSLEEKILMDADLLDEVGALTAVWDSMATAMESEPEYMKVYDRCVKFYNKVAGKKCSMKTATGRIFYEERLNFLNQFISNLEFELGIEK